MYFGMSVANQTAVRRIDFHSMENTIEVNGEIFRNIFFCVQQKKETHTRFEQLEGE